MKDLSNENVIHVKKDGIEYLQFRKLLEYSDIVKHAYAIGLDKNFRTARAKNATPLTPEEYEKAVNDYKNLANFIGIDYINIVGGIVHMKIGLASDHGGYNLKSEIIKHLKEKGIEFCCGKSEMIRTGVFDDTDIALTTHVHMVPVKEDFYLGNPPCNGYTAEQVTVRGKAAHGAIDPWNGVNALSITTSAIQMMGLMRRPSGRKIM